MFIQYKGKVVTIQCHVCSGPREMGGGGWAEDVDRERHQAGPIRDVPLPLTFVTEDKPIDSLRAVLVLQTI